jgi:streptogramin lyase
MKASAATRARGDASRRSARAGGETRRPLALALALACAAGLVAGSTASELTFEKAVISGLNAFEYIFRGAVATNDGRITLVPSAAESIVIFNETDQSLSTVATTGTAADVNKYYGGARVADGRVVFAPFLGRSKVGVFDPSTDTFSEEGTEFTSGSFTGAVLTRDDEVVLVPGQNYYKVGIFNPSDNTVRRVSISHHGGIFHGGALAGDGRVVFTPYHGSNIGVFNPTDDSFVLVDIAAKLSTSDQFYFQGAATTRDGRVVFAPYNEDAVGIFDPVDDSYTSVDISSQIAYDGKFSGAVLAGDGRIVFAPHNGDGVGIFDPTDNSFEFVSQPSGFTAGTDLQLFSGAALTSDGRVVFAPLKESGVGILRGLPDPNFPDHPCPCASSAGFNVDKGRCGANGRGWVTSGTTPDCPYTHDTSSAPAAITTPPAPLAGVVITPEVSSLSCAGDGDVGSVLELRNGD